MKLLVISLCTQGIMREHFECYCKEFSKYSELYCITNDNVSNEDLHAVSTLNVRYRRTDPLGYFSPVKLQKMKKFIDGVNPDVIYIFSHHATSVLLPPLIKKYRVIYQIHDPIPHQGIGWLNAAILRMQTILYAKFADRLIVSREALKRQVLDHYRADAEKITVIPFATLDSFIDDESEPAPDNVDLLFFGRIEPYKGLDVLISALQRMKRKPNIYIAGKGTICDSNGKEMKLPENVVQLGFVENKKLICYIKKSKAIVLPYHEASGTFTVCQAFYYGTPVIVSDVGTLPECAMDGGLVFKRGDADQLADCIEALLSDEVLQQRLSANARRRYEACFTLKRISELYRDMFNGLMEEHGAESSGAQ